MKICVVIPCFNVADNLKTVISGIKKHLADIVVVDDGSTDSTAALAADSGVKVLRNKVNSGKGISLKAGFQYALDQGYDGVITIDGDGQHSADDLPNFLKAYSGRADVVVGNRMAKPGQMPLVRQLVNKIMSGIISVIARQRITDTQCGYRLIKARCLKAIELKSSRFEIESEIILEAARSGHKITSVDIQSIYRNNASEIDPFIDTLRFLRFVLPYLLKQFPSQDGNCGSAAPGK